MGPKRWPGRPMTELCETVSAAYGKGDRICLDDCPEPGTVVKVRLVGVVFQYRAQWDKSPGDDG